ncbi:unnamed protein product, partial [Prunus brigantina]
MSRRWIQNPNRCADEYLDGIEDFIAFARAHNPGATRIRCPCRRCNNTLWETIENVQFHLVRNGMIETYSTWTYHGEQLDIGSSSRATGVENVEPIVDPNEQVMDILNDAFPFASTSSTQEGEDDVPTSMGSADFEEYEKLLQTANKELYPGCEKFSVLTAIVELMHGKIKYRMSNLYIEGKTKDTIKARLDLEKMGIRRGLWMKRDSHKARRDLAFFSMTPNDKKEFLKFVSTVKFPDGYASNIARCVNVDGGRFTGLKSHDCHVFMQRLLPVGIRHLLPKDEVKPIVLLSRFFSQLSAKTLRRTDVNKLRHDIVQVLCKFEMIFPPAFFTSMIHVMVHLPEEALLAGPVNYRWMYPIERQGSVKIDHGLLSVNTNKTWYDDDPYILANMAKQIVYLDDPKAGHGWKVVQQMDQ